MQGQNFGMQQTTGDIYHLSMIVKEQRLMELRSLCDVISDRSWKKWHELNDRGMMDNSWDHPEVEAWDNERDINGHYFEERNTLEETIDEYKSEYPERYIN